MLALFYPIIVQLAAILMLWGLAVLCIKIRSQSRNRGQKNGELIDQVPAMFDESLNPVTQRQYNPQSAGQRRRGRRCQGLSDTELLSDDDEMSVPFCDTCLFNHNMVLQLLASYEPDVSDPAYKDYDTAVEAYKAAIEKRYPPLCSECAPKVQCRITQTNTRIRTRYFGEILQRSRTTPFVDPLPRRRWWKVLGWLGIFGAEWMARGLMVYMCWTGHTSIRGRDDVLLAVYTGRLTFACTAAMESMAVLWRHMDGLPRLGLPWTMSMPTSSLNLIIGVACLTVLWDPTWLRRLYKRQRAYPRGLLRYRVHMVDGGHGWMLMEGGQFVVLAWICTPTPPRVIRLCDKPTSKVRRVRVQPLPRRKRNAYGRLQQQQQLMSGESDTATSPLSTPPDSPRQSTGACGRDPNALIFSDDDDDTLCTDTAYSTSLGTMLQKMTLGTPRSRRTRDAISAAIDAATTNANANARRDGQKKKSGAAAKHRKKAAPLLFTDATRAGHDDADVMDWAPTTPNSRRQRAHQGGGQDAFSDATAPTGATGLFRVPPSFQGRNRFGQTYLTE
ncbi:Ima1 N-terminal domain-containing protein, partial [Syncephalis pseudoplumigaleata]